MAAAAAEAAAAAADIDDDEDELDVDEPTPGPIKRPLAVEPNMPLQGTRQQKKDVQKTMRHECIRSC